MSNYSGARFFKCDLHMHSPMDGSWREESTKINQVIQKKGKRGSPRISKRCYEVGLEVIAITDHNFLFT